MKKATFILGIAISILSCNPAEENIEAFYRENYPNETYEFKRAELVDTLMTEGGDTMIGYGYVHFFRISSVTSSGQWSPITWLKAQRCDTVDLDLNYRVLRTRENSERAGQ